MLGTSIAAQPMAMVSTPAIVLYAVLTWQVRCSPNAGVVPGLPRPELSRRRCLADDQLAIARGADCVPAAL